MTEETAFEIGGGALGDLLVYTVESFKKGENWQHPVPLGWEERELKRKIGQESV